MISSFYLAWQYVSFHKARTLTLVLCIVLISAIPISLQLLTRASEQQLTNRASSTPLVVGAKGSALDLLMNTLYFGEQQPGEITLVAKEAIEQSGLAQAIPLLVKFKARGAPIVGTTIDYFEFRGLEIASGRGLALLGECVLGAEVATRLGLVANQSIISSPESLFQVAGVYPLKMKIVGILQPTQSADDLAIFVDLKTAWIIAGIGHGHQELSKADDDSVILNQVDNKLVANAKLVHYNEVTDKNIASFHFHGDLAHYPITAVLAVPNSSKSGTILRGRYLESNQPYQIVESRTVIDHLLQTIFRIRRILDGLILVVGCGTVLAIAMIFALSLRLRQRELQTNFRLGCSKLTTVRLITCEVLIILALSIICCAAVIFCVNYYAADLVRLVIAS